MEAPNACSTAILFLLTLTFVQSEPPQCEINLNLCRPNSNRTSYVYERTAAPHEFPWMVLLTTFPTVGNLTETHQCAGVLIEPDLVLVAAHCLYSSDPNVTTMACHDDYITAGEHNRCYCTQEVQYRNTNRSYVHPSYFRNDTAGLHNIALIHTEKEKAFAETEYVIPLDIEKAFEIPTGDQTLTLVGWGSNKDGSILGSIELQKTNAIEVNSSECADLFPGFNETFQICAVVNDADSCAGDSGGPLLVTKGNVTTLYGLLSSGFYAEGKCDGVPGVYTRVSAYEDILNRVLVEEFWKDKNNGFEPCKSCTIKVNCILLILCGLAFVVLHLKTY